MKKVVILTSSEGHASIASAIAQKLTPAYETQIVTYLASEFDFYIPIYQFFPSFFRVPYKISEVKRVSDFVRKYVKRKYKNHIFHLLDDARPDLIISTFLHFDSICSDYAKLHNIASYNVVANPRTIHPLEGCPNSHNMVFDAKAAEKIHTYGVQKKNISSLGWFVQNQFVPVKNKELLRKKLNLATDTLTLLFSSGSDGSSTIVKVLPLFFQINSDIQAVFVCGNNASLYRSLKIFEKSLRAVRKKNVIRFVTTRFVKNMHEYIQASDLVIGKAGPNSLFETTACHVPFFAVTHISGQEDGNLDIIMEKNLGFVEENPLFAAQKLLKLIENPKILATLQPSIIKMAKYNSLSGAKLLSLLDRV